MARRANARLMRIALPVLLVVAVLAGIGVRLLHHTRPPSSAPPGSRYAGTLTLVNPNGFWQYSWGSPDWIFGKGGMTGLLWSDPLEVAPHGRYFAVLAAQAPTAANGGLKIIGNDEEITYRLKPHLRWSDGSPITAADFIAPLLVIQAPEYGSNYIPYRSARVSGTTLVLRYQGMDPSAPAFDYTPIPWEYLQRKYGLAIPTRLTTSFDASQVAAVYAAPAYKGSALQRLIVKLLADPYDSPRDLFNGPYRISSGAIHGSYGTLVVAPNPYFTALPSDPHHPRPAAIRLVAANGDPSAATAAMLARKLPAGADVAGPVDPLPAPATFGPVPASYRLLSVPLLEPEHLDLNQANPALRDKRVRQALLYAIDKLAYLRELYHFNAAQATAFARTSPFPHLFLYSIDDQLPVNLYNLGKARALLAAAGYAVTPGGPGRHLHLDYYTASAAYRANSARILQRMWGRIGIDVTLHLLNQRAVGGLFSSYANGGILSRRRFDIVEYNGFGFTGSLLNYSLQLDPGQIPDGGHPDGANYAGVQDRSLYALLFQAQHTLDDATRQQLYARFQRMMVDQAYWIALYDGPSFDYVKQTIGNFDPYGGYGVDGNYFWNAYQWYVKRVSGRD